MCWITLRPGNTFFCLLVLIPVALAIAQIPSTISYQGRLVDAGGNPVADGDYVLTFRIFDVESGGSPLWMESQPGVHVEGGVFEFVLGSITPLNLAFDAQYWGSIAVGNDPELLPRIPLTSSPYALNAAMLDGSDQVVRSVEGLSDDIDLEAGSNINIDVTGNTITISSSGGSGGGDITAVYAGEGLNGGGDTGDVTLAVNNPLELTGTSDGVIYASHPDGASGQLASPYDGVYGRVTSSTAVGVYGSSVVTTGSSDGVHGHASSSAGAGVYGNSSATDGETFGVLGHADSPGGYGVCGVYTGGGTEDGIGVYGRSTPTDYYGIGGMFQGGWEGVEAIVAPEGSSTYHGVYASVDGGSGTNYGVEGYASGGTYNYGTRSGAYGGEETYGVTGVAQGTDDVRGVYGVASGTGDCRGVYGELPGGSFGQAIHGRAFATSGIADGVWGVTDSPSGWGVYGWASATTGGGVAVYGEAGGPTAEGVIGWAYASTGANTGVWGETESPSGVGVYYSGGLTGSGAKNCVVKTSQGPRLMYCQESPESWFEDFGEGYLINGYCRVELDQLFVEAVTISESDPLKVFIELGGDCNGVYVKKGLTGFDVYELKGGTSSVPFDFRVVAKRKGFESKRLDVCEVAYRDPYLYPEARETRRRADHQSSEEPYRATEEVKRSRERRFREDPKVAREARLERDRLRAESDQTMSVSAENR